MKNLNNVTLSLEASQIPKHIYKRITPRDYTRTQTN